MTDRGDGGTWDDPLEDIDFEEFELTEPGSYDEPASYDAAYEQPPVALISCPSCGAHQHAGNKHCEQCGARLGSGTVPVAPRPLASVSAGTRALTIILAVLAGVVLLALIYTNTIGSSPDEDAADDPVDPTVTTPAVDTVGNIEQITPITISCSTELNGTTLACTNLIDDTPAYWNDNSLGGDGAVITATFATEVRLEQVQFTNLADSVTFRRNYRIRGVSIVANDLPGLPFVDELPNDNNRVHAVSTPTLNTIQVIIRVTAIWPSEAIDGRAFDELALDEIAFWGRVVESPTPETDNTEDVTP